jgi:hypothetical protein
MNKKKDIFPYYYIGTGEKDIIRALKSLKLIYNVFVTDAALAIIFAYYNIS